MKKKYFIVSDIHSYFTIMKEALDNHGFDINNKSHVLILNGDAFDRGRETMELFKFLTSIPKDQFIYIRGNHEDLLEMAIEELETRRDISYSHYTNGTVQTIADYFGIGLYDVVFNASEVLDNIEPLMEFVKTSVNYVEIGDYIITHGWIPLETGDDAKYYLSENWRESSEELFYESRWLNGLLMNHLGFNEPGKTVICGHYHSSYGNFNYLGKGSGEFTDDADFGIYINDGIIALDAATHYSKKINVYVIEE